MRSRSHLLALLVSVAVAACGSDKHPATDASPPADAPTDAATCLTQLLTGGTDVGAQGWSVVTEGPATLSYVDDDTKLETSTTAQASSGGQLLLTYPGAVEAGKPFQIQVVMRVDAVSPHDLSDAAAAILGAFTAQTKFGTVAERDQMIYLDGGKIGWADGNPDTPPYAFTVTDGAYHSYELAVDAAGAATVRVDGTVALARTGFVTNGAIAIGDQTNAPNVDSMLRIRSVTRLCP